jgi:hypothetical protein
MRAPPAPRRISVAAADSVARGRESALKEELIGDRNALFESAAIGEPFMEAGNDGTEHLFRIKILVGELLRGQGKQEAERLHPTGRREARRGEAYRRIGCRGPRQNPGTRKMTSGETRESQQQITHNLGLLAALGKLFVAAPLKRQPRFSKRAIAVYQTSGTSCEGAFRSLYDSKPCRHLMLPPELRRQKSLSILRR